MDFITLKNITKTFNGVDVLKNINLKIKEGETLGILGRSGSGKSVLINMLRGTLDYKPDAGQVIFNLAICPDCLAVESPSHAGEKCSCGGTYEAKEIDFFNAERKEFASIKRRIAIMLQRNFALYDEETVIENVMRAMSDENDYEDNLYDALDLLEMVQMNHRITHVARDLSGGEKQRVVLARQLAKQPMMFLADEPTGTLDPQTAEKLHNTLIEGVKDKGITMLITSHWPEIMNDLADHVIWLENGKIKEGETLGILGRSGSGKSVLINMLRGTLDYKPDAGQVIFNLAICPDCLAVESPSHAGEKCSCGGTYEAKEIDFFNAERKEFASIKRRIAIMLQRNFALYDEETVIENVMRAMSDENDYEDNLYDALDLLEMVQMNHRITHVARDLSGGEKQRVVLARQLAKQPMMFLADEPTGTLDPQTAEKLHNTLIEGVKDKGITMLITSHWPEIMNDLADHVIWLENGEIKEEGEPEGVVNHFLETVPVPEKVENPEIGAPEVQMDDVKKHYYSIERGVVKAVDGIDLTINKEEIFGIVGLSGAGKTTLTKMLIGLTEPSSGKIEVKLGEEWVDMSKSGPLNRGRVIPYMGLLHQEYSLYPHRTILGNLTDAISLELPAEFAKIKAIHVLTTVGFDENIAEGLLNKYPDELSVGEKHRVALAQVLIKEPKIIILDEPTGTMDPITRVIVTDSILKARKELEQTFIIISHDMDFVLDVCDRSALMRGGKILDVGTPDEIVKQLTADEKEGMFKN